MNYLKRNARFSLLDGDFSVDVWLEKDGVTYLYVEDAAFDYAGNFTAWPFERVTAGEESPQFIKDAAELGQWVRGGATGVSPEYLERYCTPASMDDAKHVIIQALRLFCSIDGCNADVWRDDLDRMEADHETA